MQWTAEKIAILRERYPTEDAISLAKLLGTSAAAVRVAAQTRGIRIRPDLTRARKSRSVRDTRCSLNSDFFKTWTPEMAYTLGYVWADGTVKEGKYIALECVTDDEEIILAIRGYVKATSGIYRKPGGVDKRGVPFRPKTVVTLNSGDLVDDITTIHHVPGRKSYKDCPFPEVPAAHLSKFALGYSDGDGCITQSNKGYWAWTVVGTSKFIHGFQDSVCKQLGLRSRTVYGPYSNIYSVSWGRRTDLIKIFHWLYPSDNFVCCSRKKERWHRMFQQYA